MTESQWYTKIRNIREYCILGIAHFCDGTPNRSEGGRRSVEPCRFFSGGKCTLKAIRHG